MDAAAHTYVANSPWRGFWENQQQQGGDLLDQSRVIPDQSLYWPGLGSESVAMILMHKPQR